MRPRTGYWDVEQCAWRDGDPENVVPPGLPASGAAPAAAEMPAPRQDQETAPATLG